MIKNLCFIKRFDIIPLLFFNSCAKKIFLTLFRFTKKGYFCGSIIETEILFNEKAEILSVIRASGCFDGFLLAGTKASRPCADYFSRY